MSTTTPEAQRTFMDLLAEVKADADSFNKNFGRPRLKLIKGGGGSDSQNVTHSDKK